MDERDWVRELRKDSKKIKPILGRVEKYLLKHYGKRCPDYSHFCHACQVWHAYDALQEASDVD